MVKTFRFDRSTDDLIQSIHLAINKVKGDKFLYGILEICKSDEEFFKDTLDELYMLAYKFSSKSHFTVRINGVPIDVSIIDSPEENRSVLLVLSDIQ